MGRDIGDGLGRAGRGNRRDLLSRRTLTGLSGTISLSRPRSIKNLRDSGNVGLSRLGRAGRGNRRGHRESMGRDIGDGLGRTGRRNRRDLLSRRTLTGISGTISLSRPRNLRDCGSIRGPGSVGLSRLGRAGRGNRRGHRESMGRDIGDGLGRTGRRNRRDLLSRRTLTGISGTISLSRPRNLRDCGSIRGPGSVGLSRLGRAGRGNRRDRTHPCRRGLGPNSR